MADAEIGGHLYASGKMDARTQMHVSRWIAPLFAEFASVTPVEGAGEIAFGMKGDDLKSVAKALASMEDKEVDYVVNACLKIVRRARRNPQGEVLAWDPIWNDSI